jgi:hypothetical protein
LNLDRVQWDAVFLHGVKKRYTFFFPRIILIWDALAYFGACVALTALLNSP